MDGAKGENTPKNSIKVQKKEACLTFFFLFFIPDYLVDLVSIANCRQ
jgi:hypothetical protein